VSDQSNAGSIPKTIHPPGWHPTAEADNRDRRDARTMADIDPTKREQADNNDTQRRRWRMLTVVISIVVAMLLWLLLAKILPTSTG
jgi:hypothetical protein